MTSAQKKTKGEQMYNAEDFDGDTEMAIAVNKEVAEKTQGQQDCYCTTHFLCAPCVKKL